MSLGIRFPFARVARASKKIAISLVAFVALTVLVCSAINSFDVLLSAEAKTLLAASPNLYPSEDNIYVALAGLDRSSTPRSTHFARGRSAAEAAGASSAAD